MKKCTSYDLKLIACISMFIDHFGAIFLYECIVLALNTNIVHPLLDFTRNHQYFMINLYDTFRMIGRIAFPIYSFLIVQGFVHTRSVSKYCIRLFLFAFLSEFAFDIGFNHVLFETYSNNVFFTLGLGLIGIIILSKIENVYHAFKDRRSKIRLNIGCLLSSLGFVLALGILADDIFRCDYGFSGVLCIVLMYIFRNQITLGYTLGVLATVFLNDSFIQMYALFGLLFILNYDGEKGKSMKYFFYLYYPLHILLITGLNYLVGIRG